jgi:ElaB/YqjD/DUF883 family membrane-anchored ribosome-binding protein
MDELILEDEHDAVEATPTPTETVGDLGRELGARARRLADWTRGRVFEHPFAALGIAVAAGFVVSRLMLWRRQS